MEAEKIYSDEQIGSARKLIDILMGVPEKRRPVIVAIATAYIDGVEAGARITEDAEIKHTAHKLS